MRRPIVPQFTGEEYLRWEEARPEKYELHHGFVVAFAGGTLGHNRITLAMRDVLVRGFPSSYVFTSDVKVAVSEDSYFYPDVVVASDDVDMRASTITAPTIVVEVLSPATEGYDRIEKRAAYRAVPSLKNFVIVHSYGRRIEVDARGLGGIWATAVYDDDDAFVHGHEFRLDDVYGPATAA